MTTLTLTLPVAPTANNAYVNRKTGTGYGRIKSSKYREWIAQADAHYVFQGLGRVKQIEGKYTCELVFPEMSRGDLDGRIKLTLDWLVSRKLVQGDSRKFLRGLNTMFGPGTLVQITVRSLNEEASQQEADTGEARA